MRVRAKLPPELQLWAGAVALGVTGAVFPVGEVDWANTGKAITSARIVAPRRETMCIVSLRLYLGQILRVEQ